MSRYADKRLFSNTIFLYVLTFSTQLFSLATIPYLTRVLGATVYGKNGLAIAYMSYVAIAMDFGFILSATQKVAEHKHDKEYLGNLMTSVTVIKLLIGLILIGICFAVTAVTAFCGGERSLVTAECTVTATANDILFYLIYLLAYIANALLPDFYYRGIEHMKTITIRTVVVKFLFMCLIFIFVKDESDLLLVPVSTLIGNLSALLIAYVDLFKNYHVRLSKPSVSFVKEVARDSLPFFASRAAATAYQAMNTIVLGAIYGGAAVVGYYTAADKVVSLSKTCSSPIADSLYPYMIREKNYKMVKRLLSIAMPVIILGAIILFIFAEKICVFAFGAEYGETGLILRCLIPIMVVILPSYILCFPVMVPLGLSKYANMSNGIGMVIQLVGLAGLLVFNYMNVYSICLLTSLSEVSVFLFRLLMVVNRNKVMRKQ